MIDPNQKIIIISGTPFSGSALVAAYLADKGIRLGSKLNEDNNKVSNNFFEDIDFVFFQSQILKELYKNSKKGCPDWCFSEENKIDYSRLHAFKEQAIELLSRKQIPNTSWGWNDPRSAFLLDFWKDLLPNARFILVYRNPWEVKKAIEQLNEPVFDEFPGYAYEIWLYYNKCLLDFYNKYPEHCLLVSYNHFIQNPQRLAEKLNEKFSITFLSNSNTELDFYKYEQDTSYDFQRLIREFKGNSEYMDVLHELSFTEDIIPEISYPEINTLKVSVVIPCYNQGEYLPEALSGIESSLFKFYEIIIVNDGSDDPATIKILKQLEEQGYYVLNQENSGLAAARNNGIRLAKAPYILPLDADNRVDAEYLLKANQILDNDPATGVVYANPRYFGNRKELHSLADFDIHRFLAVNYIDACSIFRKELWEKSGGFDPNMPLMGYEDWEFWIRLAKQGVKFHHINEFLFEYRLCKDSMVSTANLPENRQKLVDYICKKHADFYKEHVLGIVSYLSKNLAETEQLYNKQNQSYNYLTHYSSMLQQTVKEYETRLHYIELSKFWKLKQLYDKVKFILSSESYTKNKKNKWLAKITFLLSSAGLKMIFKLLKKILRGIYLVTFKKYWGSLRNPVYNIWMTRNFPTEIELKEYIHKINILKYKPKISIILPVYDPPYQFFIETIESVKNQVYSNWELCIADDCSPGDEIRKLILKFHQEDNRIKYVFRDSNGNISACSNSALSLAEGEFAVFLDQSDLLTRDALYHAVVLLNENPLADLIYADEDKVDERGDFTDPYFKPEWCPDNLLSRNYLGHPVMIRMNLIRETGGFRTGFEGNQDYDLVLRITEMTANIFHIPKVLYHWRMYEKSVVKSETIKLYSYMAARKALSEALVRRNEPGQVGFLTGFRGYSIRYELNSFDMVSIIIPTKDQAKVLDRCLRSVFEKSTYPNYEVIVLSNNSVEKELFLVLEKWKNIKKDRFITYELNVPFNFSVLINNAAKKARGKYLLFLNNDTEVITADWIEAMVEQAQRKSIGVVGTKLLYYSNKIQHAGVVIGLSDTAAHVFVGYHKDGPGYFNYINTINNYSALTAACMMCRKEVFDEVHGFDENFMIEYNDIDFCLKIKDKGYNNVYLPHVCLYHYESLSRGHPFMKKASYQRHIIELAIFKNRWQKYIDNDPCYSPHLSRIVNDFQITV